jgi:hypothetical protein
LIDEDKLFVHWSIDRGLKPISLYLYRFIRNKKSVSRGSFSCGTRVSSEGRGDKRPIGSYRWRPVIDRNRDLLKNENEADVACYLPFETGKTKRTNIKMIVYGRSTRWDVSPIGTKWRTAI